MSDNPIPTELNYDGSTRILKISFDEGSTFELSAEYLRVCSPSAEVQGHSPDTAKLQVGKENVNIEKIEPNIHAGTRYLRFIIDRYYDNEPMDELNKWLFAFASYNAGPAKITRIRRDAEKMGLDPNVWFRNVEIAAAKRIGRETVQYVSNIYKYYIAYRYIVDKMNMKEEIKKAKTIQ